MLGVRAEHMVGEQPVQRLVVEWLSTERLAVVARGERPVLERFVHRALEQQHRRVQPNVAFAAATAVSLSGGRRLERLLVEGVEALVPLLALGEALGREVAEARGARREPRRAQHVQRAPVLLGEDVGLAQQIHVVARAAGHRHQLVGEEDGVVVHVLSQRVLHDRAQLVQLRLRHGDAQPAVMACEFM